MSRHPQPPTQLSLNFDDPAPPHLAAPAEAASLPASSSGGAARPTVSATVIHLSRFRPQKEEDYTELLYQRILDSVKHIG